LFIFFKGLHMIKFMFFFSCGNHLQASGHNMMDALWRCNGSVPDLKKISSYREGNNPVTRFAH
jgi:hypothetical protein